jgi:hypothetical protein
MQADSRVMRHAVVVPGSRLPVEGFRSRCAKEQILWVCNSTRQSGSPPTLRVYLRSFHPEYFGAAVGFVHSVSAPPTGELSGELIADHQKRYYKRVPRT